MHDDGFILNPHLWNDEFLNYDYIGAPWKEHAKHRVGNGGFCLRSRRLLYLSQFIPYYPDAHDDELICITYRKFFEDNGIKYAPLELAMKFALESQIPECDYDLDKCFGFHGRGEVADIFGGKGDMFKDRIKLLNTVDY